MYGVGARLDEKPELLFTLRQVDHLELIEQAGQGLAAPALAAAGDTGAKTIAAGDVADVFGIELDTGDAADGAADGAAAANPAKRRRRGKAAGGKAKAKRRARAKA